MLDLYGGGFWPAFGQLCLFYYVSAAVLHFVAPAVLPVKHIQKHSRGPNDIIRDALYSLGPLAVKAGVWTLCENAHASGASLLYSGPAISQPSDLVYLAACVLILDYAHDTWFYWTHRLLHWKPLYQHVHCVHHRSSAPTAFTGYSFHILEAALVFANELIMCWLLPMHIGLHRVYHLFTTLIHEGGHAGYEISPFLPHLANIAKTLLMGYKKHYSGFNTVQHHDLHHRYPAKHFSLYFTHWDRLCGTLHPKYEANLFSYFRAS